MPVDNPVDDMHCAICGADLFDIAKPSLSIVRWSPNTQSNGLCAVVCDDWRCLRDWAASQIDEVELKND